MEVFSAIHSRIVGPHECIDVAKSYSAPSVGFKMRVERRNAPVRVFPNLHFENLVKLRERPETKAMTGR